MFTTDMTLQEIFADEQMRPYQRFMIYFGPGEDDRGFGSQPLSNFAKTGWSPTGIVEGLKCFSNALKENRVCQYFIYDEASDDPRKGDVNLIRLKPKNADASKPWILLCAGGGYEAVCTVVEALPTARHMVDMGYEVFLLTYRVGEKEVALTALEDLEAAVRFILSNAREWGINEKDYAAGGFSAGANLISNWGASNIGYKVHNVQKPLCLFPVYTVIDLKGEMEREDGKTFLKVMYGEQYEEMLDAYNVADHIDQDYPPCYIVCGKDDKEVPPLNSFIMKERLEECGVCVVLEAAEHAPHGFGDGTGTDVEGWPKRAIAFMSQLDASGE